MPEDFEWLKTLKVGDEVAVDNSDHWHKNHFSICKVVKITPAGRIKLSDGSQYQPSGRKIGGGGYTHSYPLKKITPEILDIIERRKLMGCLRFDELKGFLDVEKLRILLQWQDELIGEK